MILCDSPAAREVLLALLAVAFSLNPLHAAGSELYGVDSSADICGSILHSPFGQLYYKKLSSLARALPADAVIPLSLCSYSSLRFPGKDFLSYFGHTINYRPISGLNWVCGAIQLTRRIARNPCGYSDDVTCIVFPGKNGLSDLVRLEIQPIEKVWIRGQRLLVPLSGFLGPNPSSAANQVGVRFLEGFRFKNAVASYNMGIPLRPRSIKEQFPRSSSRGSYDNLVAVCGNLTVVIEVPSITSFSTIGRDNNFVPERADYNDRSFAYVNLGPCSWAQNKAEQKAEGCSFHIAFRSNGLSRLRMSKQIWTVQGHQVYISWNRRSWFEITAVPHSATTFKDTGISPRSQQNIGK